MVGAWGVLGLFDLFAIFNTFLGEELLFRSLLLPRMNKVFRKWDWAVNGIPFGLYHVHQPWGMLSLGGLLFSHSQPNVSVVPGLESLLIPVKVFSFCS